MARLPCAAIAALLALFASGARLAHAASSAELAPRAAVPEAPVRCPERTDGTKPWTYVDVAASDPRGLVLRLARADGPEARATSGASAVAEARERPLVLFDTGHAQRFLPDRQGALDLSGLAANFEEAGATVESLATPLTVESLAPARVLVISGPFRLLAPAENEAVLAFLDRGGALAVMLHIGPPVADLLHALNVSISNGVIRETQDLLGSDPINFRVKRLAAHPLNEGLRLFGIYGAWALLPTGENARALAHTGPHAWVDLNRDNRAGPGDAMQEFAVVVAGSRGQGRFVVFGDDAMFQNEFLVGANQKLATNLISWLTGSPHPARTAAFQPRRGVARAAK